MNYCEKQSIRLIVSSSEKFWGKIANVELLAYWFLVVFFYTVGIEEKIYMYLRAIINLAAIVTVMIKNKKTYEKNAVYQEMGFIIIMYFFGIFSSVYNTNATILGYIYNMISSVGIALLLSRFQIYCWIPYMIYIIFAIFLFSYFFKYNGDLYYFLQPGGNSRNYISVLILTITALIYISEEDNNNGNYIWSFIALFFCVLAVGRGGILASVTLLLFNVLIWMKKSSNSSDFIVKGLFAVTIFVIVLALIFSLGIFDKVLGNFAIYGMDSPREEVLWRPYLRSLEYTPNLFFGAYYRELVGKYDHLHNSYLMIHARFGMFFLIILMIMLIRSFIILWRKRKYFQAALLVVYLQRAFTDSMLGFSYCDTILLYYVFVNMEHKKYKEEIGRN